MDDDVKIEPVRRIKRVRSLHWRYGSYSKPPRFERWNPRRMSFEAYLRRGSSKRSPIRDSYERAIRSDFGAGMGLGIKKGPWRRSVLGDSTPNCIKALGLSMPCTIKDIKEAFRRKAKEAHPDHGGDPKEFVRLQMMYKEALLYVRSDMD